MSWLFKMGSKELKDKLELFEFTVNIDKWQWKAKTEMQW